MFFLFFLSCRAVELGITAEDLADVEDEPEQSVFRKRRVIVEDSDTEEARTRVCV